MIKKIVVFLGVFIFSGTAIAEDTSNRIARIELKASGDTQYEYRHLKDPDRLILKFTPPGIYGGLPEDAQIGVGAIKNIKVIYYPSGQKGAELRRIKFISFWLQENSSYKIWSKGNRIYLDFKNPYDRLAAKEIEISNAAVSKDAAFKYDAARSLLSKLENTSPDELNTAKKSPDVFWMLLFAFLSFYIMYIRPKEWRMALARLTGIKDSPVSFNEKRRWWRHNLLPLKNSIRFSVECPTSNTRFNPVPVNIGYGGLSFKCNKKDKLDKDLKIKLYIQERMLPIQLRGNIAWQRNSWNPFRRFVGVSFSDLPEKEWAGIHSYIEQQYAALDS